MHDVEIAMIAGAALVLLAAVASKLAGRFGIPAIILFLGIGMAAGSDGPGGIHFSNYQTAQTVGSIALCFILFYGGISTQWKHIRPVFVEGLLLSTIGVAVTAGIVGVMAAWILDTSLVYGFLLGAIISSTDAAAVFSILTARSLALKHNVADLLELESGINDPTAVIFTITLMKILDSNDHSAISIILEFIQQISVGLAIGYVIARVTVFSINRFGLDYEGLYPVVSVAVVALTFGVTSLANGSGFLAVYVLGLTLGNMNFTRRRSVTKFHDGIAWLSQISMFLMLGLLVFPSKLIDVSARALLVSIVLVFVARPIAVFVSLSLSKRSAPYKMLVSWVGLRGAVPIILGTFPLVEGVEHADLIFNVVFFTTLLSVIVQGTTVSWVARKLGMISNEVIDDRRPDTVFAKDGLQRVVVHPDAQGANKRIVELDVPRDTLFVLVSRENEHELPHGSTVLQPGDAALMLGNPESVEKVKAKLTNEPN